MANQPKNLGNLHHPKTGILKHREWRGFKDTIPALILFIGCLILQFDLFFLY